MMSEKVKDAAIKVAILLSIVMFVTYLVVIIAYIAYDNRCVDSVVEYKVGTIVYAEHEDGILVPMKMGNSTIWTRMSDKYKVKVSCEDKEYILTDEESYVYAKYKIGDTVEVAIKVMTLANGRVKREPVSIK